MKYPILIFDLDGTLVDSYQALTTAVNAARASAGLEPLALESVRELTGEGVDLLLSRSFGDAEFPESFRQRFEESYDEVCTIESRVLEDVAATVDSLSDAGCRMGVCTNKPTRFSKKILDYLGIGRYFAVVAGPDVAGARKPDPHHVLWVLKELGASAETALFVGDMPIDVLAAREAGVACAVIATGSSPRAALVEAKPDYVLESFADLVQIVTGGTPA
jgi:phosphoglycolate phosphatase